MSLNLFLFISRTSSLHPLFSLPTSPPIPAFAPPPAPRTLIGLLPSPGRSSRPTCPNVRASTSLPSPAPPPPPPGPTGTCALAAGPAEAFGDASLVAAVAGGVGPESFERSRAPREVRAKGSVGGALVVAAAAVLDDLAPGTVKNGLGAEACPAEARPARLEAAAGSGPFLARLAAARSTNGALANPAPAPALAGCCCASGLRICCFRSRIFARTAVERSSRVGVWVCRPTVGGAAVGMGSARGTRLDRSGARAQAEQAREGWRWTVKVVVPMRIALWEGERQKGQEGQWRPGRLLVV